MNIYEKTQRFYESVKGEKSIIGKSYFGRDLYAVKIGSGSPVGLAQYALHGREYPVAELAFLHYARGTYKGSLWILPLANPDGALLSETGISSAPKKERERLFFWNGGNENFSLWKANGRGVDLNVNFAARWGKGTKNVAYPAPENYVGEYPFSELETAAIKNFTEGIRPDYTVSYHTKGEEIYWYFYQSLRACAKDKSLALALSRSTGYPLAHAKGSAGGYKDWCIQRLKIPSFTVEAGADRYPHPLTGEGVEDVLQKNERALYDLSKAFEESR